MRLSNKPTQETAQRVRAPRLQPNDRIRLIIDEAAKLFAEHGFEAGTSDLARRVGITQPLLYRYFRSKEELLKRVYSEAYSVDELYPRWERLVLDRRLSLRERLVQFYLEYSELTWNYTFTRMALWANLSRPEMNRTYHDTVRRRIFPRIVRAMRIAYGHPRPRGAPSELELELVHSLHGMMYHLAIRRWVHAKQLRYSGDVRPLIEIKIDLFLRGAEDLVRSSAAGRNGHGPEPHGAQG